jgi:hypothetical protein
MHVMSSRPIRAANARYDASISPAALRVADQVHLVHDERDAADSEQRHDAAVARVCA